jgi:CRP-like cAMP-binding protein
MPVSKYREEMDRQGCFYQLLARYTQALIAVVMQSAACNAVHSIEERFARWVLTVSDRMESASFPLTHEFAAMMLGASRPTVTIVAGVLQRKGLITSHRAHIDIADRTGLEKASCECYSVTRRLLETVRAGR